MTEEELEAIEKWAGMGIGMFEGEWSRVRALIAEARRLRGGARDVLDELSDRSVHAAHCAFRVEVAHRDPSHCTCALKAASLAAMKAVYGR